MRSEGFSAAELLITLFIGAAFILSGYQLHMSVVTRGAYSGKHAITSAAALAEIKRLVNNADDDTPIDCASLPDPATYDRTYGKRMITYERSYSCPDSVNLPNLREITVKGGLDGVSTTHSTYYRQS